MQHSNNCDVGSTSGTCPTNLSRLARHPSGEAVPSSAIAPSLWASHRMNRDPETPHSTHSSVENASTDSNCAPSNAATTGSLTPSTALGSALSPSTSEDAPSESGRTAPFNTARSLQFADGAGDEDGGDASCISAMFDITPESDPLVVEGASDDGRRGNTSPADAPTGDALGDASTADGVLAPGSGCLSYTLHGDLLGNVAQQRRDIVKKAGAAFSLMVAGESSMGKSTFVRTLLGADFASNCSQVPKSFNKMSQVVQTTEIEVYHQVVTERGVDVDLTVIDTPGFGNYVNNGFAWVPIVNYIESQNLHYMCAEEQPDRTQLKDTRVNVCIYFLPPTGRVHALDLKAMHEISLRTNLIPVIAKADSMTPEDLVAQQQDVRALLHQQSIQCFARPPQYEPPFALVCSDTTVTTASGAVVRGREYRWGTVDVDNPEHSDFNKLREFVFAEHMLDLMQSTEHEFYERYRRDMRLFRLAKALSFNEDAEALAACAREAASMTGMEILSAVSKFGEKSLTQYLDEKDALFKQRVFEIRRQFDIVLKFQQERFDAQTHHLEGVRARLNDEIAAASRENIGVVQAIRELETQVHRK